MANWFTNQKAKRLLGDMPLTEDMTGSGGAHNQNKGYGDSDGPPMMSKGPHSAGHGGKKDHTHATEDRAEGDRRTKEPLKPNERQYMGDLTQDQSKGNILQRGASHLRNFASDVVNSPGLRGAKSSGKKMF